MSLRRSLRPSQEISIRIFPLSSEDIFEKNNLGYAIYWLMQKADKPYYFRDKTPRDFPAGSIALFNYESQIFGQAITSEDVKKFSDEEQRQHEPYKASVKFWQSSIDVFREYPCKQEVESILGKEYSRNFTKVTWGQYQEILKLAGRRL